VINVKLNLNLNVPRVLPRREMPSKGYLDRGKIADLLLGSGVLPKTRLGAILAHPHSQYKELGKIMREVLTFTDYQPASEIITKVIEEVNSLSTEEIMAEAQAKINILYHEKIERYENFAMRADFPTPPTLESFSKISPNGHFDPYQYFASQTWGIIKARFDWGRLKGYERALANFDLKNAFREAYVVALALSKIPA